MISTPTPRWQAATAASVLLLATAGAAHAQLQARDADGDGVADAYHDATLDITWLARADAAAGSALDDGLSSSDGLLTWAAAQAWVAGLSVAGSSGWRLPSLDSACNGNGLGYGCSNAAGELGHQFHGNLGGQAGQPISGTHNSNFNLFSGVADVGYWSGTAYASDPDQAGVLLFAEGYQDYAFKAFGEHAAWAVHDGDVLAVPEPNAACLLLAGLLGLAWRGRPRWG